MKGGEVQSACRICEKRSESAVLWQNDHWYVSHAGPPRGAVGWMTLYSVRHVRGIADFSTDEALDFGPTLTRLQSQLEAATGALRIYTASMNESAAHFHMHLVPRYQSGPKLWEVFLDQQRAARGELEIDPIEVESISATYAQLLAQANPEYGH
jgi:diadenosine tetraphosphate (Ap4A) HIT family hydrolase